MSSFLAPLLAQLVLVGAADRVEARYVAAEGNHDFESSNSTTALASVAFTGRRASLTLSYTPNLNITPLEGPDTEFLLNHAASITGELRFRRTSLTLNQTATYGERNFTQEALTPNAAPPTTGGRPPAQGTPPAPNDQGGAAPGAEQNAAPFRSNGETVSYGSLHTSLTLGHEVSRQITFSVSGGYGLGGGTDLESRIAYPIVQGPDLGASVTYRPDVRNTLTTTLSSQMLFTDTSDTFGLFAGEDWTHNFSARTHSSVGAGLAYTRTPKEFGAVLHAVYPAGRASINHSTRLAQGTLGFGLTLATAPSFDITTGIVDPRVSFGANVNWSRKRFSVNANADSTFSISNQEAGSFDSVGMNLGVSYDIGAGFSTDAGLRSVWQNYEGNNTIPLSHILYVGLAWGGAVPLVGRVARR